GARGRGRCAGRPRRPRRDAGVLADAQAARLRGEPRGGARGRAAARIRCPRRGTAGGRGRALGARGVAPSGARDRQGLGRRAGRPRGGRRTLPVVIGSRATALLAAGLGVGFVPAGLLLALAAPYRPAYFL